MIRKAIVLFFGLLMVTAAVALAAPFEPPIGAPAGPDSNLLTNPSFEGQYSAYIPPPPGHPDCQWGPCQTAQMADGWTPYWRSHDPDDPPWIIAMPEYKPADPIFTDPVRVRSGNAAQQYFTFFKTHEAGIYQQVPVTPGAEYCFSVWGHSWSAQDDDDAYSGPEYGVLNQRIGIDPTGDTDWHSNAIVWGPQRTQYDYYGLFEIRAVAQTSTLTVYTYSQPMWAVKHNDVYWDDADLSVYTHVLDPAGPFGLLADVDVPQAVDYVIPMPLNGDPTLHWQASLEPGGSLTPTLSAVSGAAGEDLVVTIDSSGYPVGTYSANVVLTVDPMVPCNTVTVPLTLIVVAELEHTYLSLALKP